MIKAYSASITLTNHILERLLKLALIKDELKLERINFEKWNETYTADKFEEINNSTMFDTIKKCHERKLIDDEEKEHLTYIRQSIRNGFSHYTPKAILKDNYDTKTFTLRDRNHNEIKKIEMNYKDIPIFQSHYIDQFTREHALEYFDYVFVLINSIKNNLMIKHRSC
ncbi:MAG: hypothetical protein BM557_09985 [Flavobacterium sp. MedPE-SWcel]|uniref:hypothetical protein n=1 Tax=uncultured Flavobacterium sp. TaxID=165435 RepID=UPI00091C3DAA|nr:hypothetical protein [uncultured Flavobacterium sp.]OIQ16631.1 MAG: hypothetical protein BM557_09985 [Flavobacterium sp. MedPE-SWcel]